VATVTRLLLLCSLLSILIAPVMLSELSNSNYQNEIRHPDEVYRLTGHSDVVLALSFDDQHHLYSAGRDGKIYVWDLDIPNEKTEFRSFQLLSAADINLQASSILCRCTDDWNDIDQLKADLRVIDLTSGSETSIPSVDILSDIALSNSGDLISGLTLTRWEGAQRIWQVSSGQLIGNYDHDFRFVWSVAFHPSSLLVASGDEETLTVMEVSSGAIIAEVQQFYPISNDFSFIKQVVAIDYSADGAQLASLGDDFSLWIWDTETYSERLHILSPSDQSTEVSYDRWPVISFSADGRLVVYSCSEGLCIINSQHGQKLISIPENATAVAFNTSGTLLALGKESGEIKIYDLESIL